MPPLPSGFYPFWFWNDTLTDAEIRWQVAEMAAQGIRGFFIHSRQGLKDPAYLSEAFFERVKTALDAAREHGLVVHLYDEYPYPSGAAGGMVALGEPQYLASELIQRACDLEGGKVRWELPPAKVLSLIAFPLHDAQVDWNAPLDLTGAVGVVLEEDAYQETGLTRYNQKRYFANRPRPVLQTSLPAGRWRVVASLQRTVEQHKYWGHFSDVLNPRAVERFIRLTHERYRQHLGDQFGQSIRWIFTDEVMPGWSAGLPEDYRREYGRDLLPLLPALQDPAHPEHTRLSVELHRLRLKLFCQTFEEPISTWCRDHHLAYAAEKPSLRFSQLRYQDIPGCEPGHVKAGAALDLLQPGLRGNAKATACAAYFYAKDGALDECYHSLGWSATLEDVRWMADAQLLLGIRYLVPHGFFYSTHNLRKHDAPPSLFFQAPYWPLFGHLARRVEHIGQAFEGTWIEADLAVIDPTAGLPTPQDRTTYENWLQELMAAHIDFHIVDTDVLESGQLEAGGVKVRDVTLHTILVPPMRYREPALVAWLERFVQAGGKVVDSPAGLENRSLSLRSNGGENPALWSVQRRAAARTLWFVLNTSGQSQPVELDAGVPLRELRLENGASPRLESGSERFFRQFAPFEAVLLEAAPQASENIVLPEIELSLDREMSLRPLAPNLARLYDWQMTILDEDGTPLQAAPVQAVPLANQLEQGRFRLAARVERAFGTPPELGWPELRLRYTCTFQCVDPGPVELVMEPGSLVGDWSLQINATPALGPGDFGPSAAHVRGSLGVAIRDRLSPGLNRLQVDLTTAQPDGGLRNPLYLAGAFGVTVEPLSLVAPRSSGRFEQYRANDLPYYSGVVEYRFTCDLAELPAPRGRCRVKLEFPAPFHEACEIAFNASGWHPLPWGPYQVEIDSRELRSGANEIALRVYTTLLRAFEGQENAPQQ